MAAGEQGSQKLEGLGDLTDFFLILQLKYLCQSTGCFLAVS